MSFESQASNLVSNDSNNSPDVFLSGAPYVADTVEFNPSSYNVAEDGGSATITVTRTPSSCGASGMGTIDYATSDGTATAGRSDWRWSTGSRRSRGHRSVERPASSGSSWAMSSCRSPAPT